MRSESYFPLTLLLQKTGAFSFTNMRLHEGVQNLTYRDTFCAKVFHSDNAEWLRCMVDAFSSDFNQLTEVFSMIIAFWEPAIPQRI